MDKEKIKERIRELETLLHVPPEGRMGGKWEEPYRQELIRLYEYLRYSKEDIKIIPSNYPSTYGGGSMSNSA